MRQSEPLSPSLHRQPRAFKSIQPLFAKGAQLSSTAAVEKQIDQNLSLVAAKNTFPSFATFCTFSQLTENPHSPESLLNDPLSPVDAKWSDAARAASKNARRAMGWPILPQRWIGVSRGNI